MQPQQMKRFEKLIKIRKNLIFRIHDKLTINGIKNVFVEKNSLYNCS